MFDGLIIGSGPAGISAALTLKQAGFSVAVASMMGSYLLGEELPGDCYGLDGLSGEELYKKGIRQAKHCGVEFFGQPITGLTRSARVFTALGQTPITAKSVLLATGAPAAYSPPDFAAGQPNVHWRVEDDGFLYRNRLVGVLGNDSYAVGQARLLAKTARAVTLFTNGAKAPTLSDGIGINTYTIRCLQGENKLERILFENDTGLNLDGLFLADRTATAADLCAGVGAACEGLIPQIDNRGATSVEGLFGAGDCTGKTHTLQERSFHGYSVAQGMMQFLKK